jgi:hypothetical protein
MRGILAQEKQAGKSWDPRVINMREPPNLLATGAVVFHFETCAGCLERASTAKPSM